MMNAFNFNVVNPRLFLSTRATALDGSTCPVTCNSTLPEDD